LYQQKCILKKEKLKLSLQLPKEKNNMTRELQKRIEIGVEKKQDMSEDLVKSIYLGIGSNLGDKKRNIERTKLNLIINNIKILKCSSYYESLSWPNPNNPKFLNIVLEIDTNFSALELINKCKKIEKKLGRKKLPKNSPRECDIDIIDFRNKKTIGDLILPHPRMDTRNFVLLPLFEINKDWKHPILKVNIRKLISDLSNSDIRSIKQI